RRPAGRAVFPMPSLFVAPPAELIDERSEIPGCRCPAEVSKQSRRRRLERVLSEQPGRDEAGRTGRARSSAASAEASDRSVPSTEYATLSTSDRVMFPAGWRTIDAADPRAGTQE